MAVSSGLVVSTSDCSPRGPIDQPALCFFTKTTVIHSCWDDCTLTAVPSRLSLPPAVVRRNEYKPHSWAITQIAISKCMAYDSLQMDSQVKFTAQANIHSSDPSEFSQWLCRRWEHYEHRPGYYYYLTRGKTPGGSKITKVDRFVW